MADLRKTADIDDRVVAAVTRRSPLAHNVQIVGVQDKFLDGKLFTVGFDGPAGADGQRTSYTNRVYVTKDAIEAYGHDEFLIQVVGARHSRSPYDFLANGQVISGVIALIVTLLVVPTFIMAPLIGTKLDVPTWITSGWLLILGFYFGKATSRSD